MKRLRALLPALLLPLAPPAAAQGSLPRLAPAIGFEARFGGVAFSEDCWDDSAAAFGDVALTLWEPNGAVGLWLGVGAQGASCEWTDDWGPVESDIAAVPFGASVLGRLELAPGLALRAEAGARYVAMDVDDWDDDRHRRYRRRDDWDRYHHPDRYLDVDDTSLAVVALQLEFAFDQLRIAVGGGYQFDLQKPDIEYLDEPIGQVDLSGAMFFASLGVVF